MLARGLFQHVNAPVRKHKAVTERTLDVNTGLAKGQPEFSLDDSLSFQEAKFPTHFNHSRTRET